MENLIPQETTTLEVEYSQKGHPHYPEDTWSESHNAETEDELFDFIKFCHKQDARNRNDFPLAGSVSGSFEFKKVVTTTLMWKGKLLKHREEIVIPAPEHFIPAWVRYQALMERARKTLPNLRDAKERRAKDAHDHSEFERLKQKFNA